MLANVSFASHLTEDIDGVLSTSTQPNLFVELTDEIIEHIFRYVYDPHIQTLIDLRQQTFSVFDQLKELRAQGIYDESFFKKQMELNEELTVSCDVTLNYILSFHRSFTNLSLVCRHWAHIARPMNQKMYQYRYDCMSKQRRDMEDAYKDSEDIHEACPIYQDTCDDSDRFYRILQSFKALQF